MKVLRGSITETRYAFPEDSAPEKPMTIISETTYQKNAVTYMADELGLHRVTNRGSEFAVSLHRERALLCPRDACPHADNCLDSVHAAQRGQGRLPRL